MSFKSATETIEINRALFQVTHGLYVLTAKRGDKYNGQCLDACMQVTNMPPKIAIGVGKKSLTHEMIMETGVFAVNVIDREDAGCYDKVKHFGMQSGRKVDKFANTCFEKGANGAPILPDAKAFYECTVVKELTADLGTHTLFIGLVTRAGTKESGEPLTYNEYRKAMKRPSS